MKKVNEKYLRSMNDVVETLRNAKDRDTKCSVLIGAGCSVTAGIPTASGFLDVIKNKYPTKYERANPKTYPSCMEQLSVNEQRALIAEYADKAKVNWGHIALAQLIKEGYVDRVLTTNFDSLTVRACALVGEFPAVYDFASSQNFEPDKVPDKAIFYLHGQRTGFVLMNEEKVLSKQSKLMDPVFEDAGRGRIWIVVGYSGENDPVFEHLAATKNFDNNLYWVGYEDVQPGPHVIERLLSEEKDNDAYFVPGYDADGFFVTLAQQLGCYPPAFVRSPFSHIEDIFENLPEYVTPKVKAPIDAFQYAQKFVREAINKMEGVQGDVLQAWSDFMGENYDKVIELRQKPEYVEEMHPEVQEVIAWAYNFQGVDFANRAVVKTGKEADDLFEQSTSKFIEATKVKPDLSGTYHNWGWMLAAWAGMNEGEKADELYKQAATKYEAAIGIYPESSGVFNNWAILLSDWGWTKEGPEAENLFKESVNKFSEAVRLNPDYADCLNNWGRMYYRWSQTADITADVNELLESAIEKYKETIQVEEDYYYARNNWALALAELAQRKEGSDVDLYFQQAVDKYMEGAEVTPEYTSLFENWGDALSAWAKTKNGKEAVDLYKQAADKYSNCVQLDPNSAEGYVNWGTAYLRMFRIDGAKNKKYFEEAEKLLKKADELRAGRGAYNLACLYALNNTPDESLKWLTRAKETNDIPKRDHIAKDTDLENVKNLPWFEEFLKELE